MRGNSEWHVSGVSEYNLSNKDGCFIQFVTREARGIRERYNTRDRFFATETISGHQSRPLQKQSRSRKPTRRFINMLYILLNNFIENTLKKKIFVRNIKAK